MTRSNKEKHAYELLGGDRISIGWLGEPDMRFLEMLKDGAQGGESYFDLLRLVRGKGAYPLKGSQRLTSEVAQSVLYRVASDIVERAGIRQGVALEPGSDMESPDDRPLVSLSEAAEIIGMSRAGVHLALTKGRLKGWQVGSIWVLDLRDVKRYRDNRNVVAVTA